jgi:hypothetical protein
MKKTLSTVFLILALFAQISCKKFKTNTKTKVSGSTLYQSQNMYAGDAIKSSNGVYTFIMQTDGNLVIYGCAGAIWAANTWSANPSQRVVSMQSDGNLVLYEYGSPIWASNSGLQYNGPYRLTMQDDGNLVIYNGSSSPIWASNTMGKGACSQQQQQSSQFCATFFNQMGYTDTTINISYIDGSGNTTKCSLDLRMQGGQRYCCTPTAASKDTSFNYQAGKRYVNVKASGIYKDQAKIESVEVNGKVLDAFYDMSNGTNVSGGYNFATNAYGWFILSVDSTLALRQVVIDFDTYSSINSYNCYNTWWSF